MVEEEEGRSGWIRDLFRRANGRFKVSIWEVKEKDK